MSPSRAGVWVGKGSPLSERMMRQQSGDSMVSPSGSERGGDREIAGLGIRNHHQQQ